MHHPATAGTSEMRSLAEITHFGTSNSGNTAAVRDAITPAEAFEPHFKIKELAERWHMSITTVFALFANEPGVLRIGSRNARRRTKVSIVVPLSVAQRVYERLQVKDH